MATAEGLRKVVTYKKEQTFGAIASGENAKEIRRVSSNFNLTKETYQSEEIREDYQLSDYRHGVRSVEGSISGELSSGSYTDFLAAAVARDFMATPRAALPSTKITSTIAGVYDITRTSGNFIADGLRVGNVFRLTGFNVNNNNKNLLVVSLTPTKATVVTLNNTTLTLETVVSGASYHIIGATTYAPSEGHTDHSYTVEEWYSNIGQSEVTTGNKVNTVSIALPATGLTTIDVGFSGQDLKKTSTTQHFSTANKQGAEGIFAAVNGALIVDGKVVSLVTSLNININRNISSEAVVGSSVKPELYEGRVAIDGDFSTLFKDRTFANYFNDESEISLVVALSEDSSNSSGFMTITLPRIKLGTDTKDDGEKGIVSQNSFQALKGNGLNGYEATTIMIQDSKEVVGTQNTMPELTKLLSELFSNNEEGFVYDFTDTSSMFQDASGTKPIGYGDQPIGFIEDISGNGHHARQTNSSMRPLLKSFPRMVEYDGIDDKLVVPILNTLTDCTVVRLTQHGIPDVLVGQTVNSTYLENISCCTVIVIARALSSDELLKVRSVLNKLLTYTIEFESEGLQTVKYTALGQPTYMNIIQKYNMSTIDESLSGTHPAFIVDGVEKPEILIGTYQGVVKGGELLSLPNVDPTHSTNYDNFLIAARANGNGHHLITNAEWSAVALQCYKNKTQPMGNSYYGRSSEDPLLVGRRADGLNAGDMSGSARTLTGSGPVQWRHNGKNNGIADISGNILEWNSGIRLVNGEIQVIDNNNAAKLAIDLSAASSEWKAIDGATGVLVTPNGSGTTKGTVKFAASGTTADYTIYGASFGAVKNLSTTKPMVVEARNKLKALCLFPHIDDDATFNSDGLYLNLNTEAQLIRGGSWSSGAAAGVFALYLSSSRSSLGANFGSRPAFVSL